MSPLASPVALFLDFDGVICNSLEECYRSSWLTLTEVSIDETTPPDPPFDSAYRSRFNACRPFIRSGEDYLVAHEWAARGLVPNDQTAFDRSLEEKGPQVLTQLKAKLYRVRDDLLARHRSLWLSWNPLYEGIAEALKSQLDNPEVRILSTKKAEFIVEILEQHGVAWPLERTLYTGSRKKLDIVAEMASGQKSILIDDQVDHLTFSDPQCHCYLALWGYVDPEAVIRARETLTLAQAHDLISLFPRSLRLVSSEATIPRR
jgi:phosphoglycolate phosphatase-like HAD superfamily hydrolase